MRKQRVDVSVIVQAMQRRIESDAHNALRLKIFQGLLADVGGYNGDAFKETFTLCNGIEHATVI